MKWNEAILAHRVAVEKPEDPGPAWYSLIKTFRGTTVWVRLSPDLIETLTRGNPAHTVETLRLDRKHGYCLVSATTRHQSREENNHNPAVILVQTPRELQPYILLSPETPQPPTPTRTPPAEATVK